MVVINPRKKDSKALLDLNLDPVVLRVMKDWASLRKLAKAKKGFLLSPNELKVLQEVTDQFLEDYKDLDYVIPSEYYHRVSGSLILKTSSGTQLAFPYALFLFEYCSGLYKDVENWLAHRASQISLDIFIERVFRIYRDKEIPMKINDVRILKHLAQPTQRLTKTKKGFPTYREIATRLRVNEATITRRMTRLVNTGSIQGFALLNPGVFGFKTVGFFRTRELTPEEEAYRVVDFPLPRDYTDERFSILHLPPGSDYWVKDHQENVTEFSKRYHGWNLAQLRPYSKESWDQYPSLPKEGGFSDDLGLLQDIKPSEDPLWMNPFDVTLLDRLQSRGIDRLESMSTDLKVAETYLYERFLRLQNSGCFDQLVGLWHFGLTGQFIFFLEGDSEKILKLSSLLPLLPFSNVYLADEMLVALVYLPSKWVYEFLNNVHDFDKFDGTKAWVRMLDFRIIRWKYYLNILKVWAGPSFSDASKDHSIFFGETDPRYCWEPIF